MAHPLARIIDQLKREPSRTGSIVITVFGDAIVPRGGSVWLGTLLEFFKTLDIDSGVVRTAMSRLATDGWLERNKVGRNSFYRLVKNLQAVDSGDDHRSWQSHGIMQRFYRLHEFAPQYIIVSECFHSFHSDIVLHQDR